MKKTLFPVASAIISSIATIIIIAIIQLQFGSRPTVYYITEYFFCPTQVTEGRIEEIERVAFRRDKMPFHRISYSQNVYRVKLDSSHHQFICLGLLHNDYNNTSDESDLFSVGKKLKIIFHENIIPWEKDRIPVVCDETYHPHD